MPQLDRIIIFPQVFWLLVIFTMFYIILTHFFLPRFLKALKARKEIVKINELEASLVSERSTDNQAKLRFLLLSHLSIVKKIFSMNSALNISNAKILNTQAVDELVSVMVKNSILFCNSQILDSICIKVRSIYSK
uniref:ATP synthase F0 subunit 8 n=1 Tax=Gelidium sclerophyllum TaxID=317102 RepID=A0A1D8X7J7_9FLOR|nr:ATP synthase F0 subunit 8 [Gelidium sclerophyllum]AOX49002.1 ATP synthase F0 subunit 8 [Gelidium sclerophyllum]